MQDFFLISPFTLLSEAVSKNCYLLGSSRGCSTHTWANKSPCIVTQERETDEAQDGLSEDNHVDKNKIDLVLALQPAK